MKDLIINADDLGLSGAVNEAVRRCVEAGTITGTSIMPCAPHFSEAVEMLKTSGVSEVGVHITLTGGFAPLAGDDVHTILDDEESFHADYSRLARMEFTSSLPEADLYKEIKSQVRLVKDAGLTITHIDSHEHIHMLPAILDTVIRVAIEDDITYVRLPYEPFRAAGWRFNVKDLVRHSALKFFALSARAKLRKAGLVSNGRFWGHFHSGRIDRGTFRFILDNISDGLNEIAVHPSVMTDELAKESSWHARARAETECLLNMDIAGECEKRGIRLLSHSELF